MQWDTGHDRFVSLLPGSRVFDGTAKLARFLNKLPAKLDGVAQEVANPPTAYSTTDTDTQPLCDICDPMDNIISSQAMIATYGIWKINLYDIYKSDAA